MLVGTALLVSFLECILLPDDGWPQTSNHDSPSLGADTVRRDAPQTWWSHTPPARVFVHCRTLHACLEHIKGERYLLSEWTYNNLRPRRPHLLHRQQP